MPTILVVCTGNICRSPTAAAFLREALERRFGPGAFEVRSAGTMAWEGSPPPPEAVAAGAELGVDLSGHRAAALTHGMVDEADLVVTMAREHRDAIHRAVPAAVGRTFTLKELIFLLEQLPPPRGEGDELLGRVADADRLRAFLRRPRRDADVVDPLGGDPEEYRRTARVIRDLVERLVAALWGPSAGRAAGRPAGAGWG
ncbi:MAG TPA: low molecular weight protein arginine phosphatase [Actinomycetota bacterium]|nr:low molecular weight protein arginine phosphatase [Actinomycetota bacterium]